MRVAVGGIYHESNTFFAQSMTLERFAESQLQYGDDIARHWRGTCSEMNGFLEGAKEFGFEIVPTIMAWGMPSGAVTADAFEALCGELIGRLKAALPVDGVLLSLHGALVAEKYLDGDAEILRRVRECIGDKVPLIGTIDFHANLTDDMVRWPNVLVGYDTYPHIDQVERGREAATLLNRMLREKLRPYMALAHRPLLPHILRQGTEKAPMRDVIAAAHEAEQVPGVLTVSVTAGFPYTDVPRAGFSVVAAATTHDAARAAAESVATLAWMRRSEFLCNVPDPERAVGMAIENGEGLTVLVDVGDNVGGGTPGDGTVLLSELLKQKAHGALVLLCDPEAVATCAAAGVRSQVTLKVGGKCDRHHGPPVEVSGTVRALHCGIYRNIGDMRDGVHEDQGRTAVIETSRILVVLTERRMPMWNLEQLRSLGIEPTRLHIVVVKAAIAYRAAYAPIAASIIEVDTPGLTTADVRRFLYKRLERPIFPLDVL